MQRRRTLVHRKLRLSPLAASVLLLCHGALASTDPEAPATRGPDAPALIPQAEHYADALARVQGLPGSAPQGGITSVVQNCNDAGNGSLRAAVAAAQTDDTIDLSQLACAKITLTTGAITIPQQNLTIDGPGASQLSIDGGSGSNHFNRVFYHSGNGTLNISQLTVTNAKYRSASTPIGGCIRSKGTLVMSYTVVSNCFLQSQSDAIRASGGGIAVSTGVIMVHSKVSGNSVSSASGAGAALGGGIYSDGDLTMKYSTVSGNLAFNGSQVEGGGIIVNDRNFYMLSSTISGNSSDSLFGGVYAFDYSGTHTARVINSTISGNYAAQGVAGIFTTATTTIANSTIAFNASAVNTYAAGFRFKTSHGTTLTLQSTIIANNSDAGSDSDTDIDPTATLSGNNNLIVQHTGPVPPNTISSCPLLGPLGNQGGETQTHRLLLGSPAIDAGNNVTKSLAFDQRGSGFPRTHGAQTDIGAFEDQGVTPNVIFIAGFEGRCR